MPKLSTQANKFYPNLPEITQDPTSYVNTLMQIKSALQTHERRDGNYLKSFVRFDELVELGIIDKEGEFILSALQLGGTLGGLLDVSISGVADSNILGYDVGTSTWLNQTPSQLGIVGEAPTDGADYVRNNSAWVASSGSGTNDHLLLANIGINTHPQIDAHLGDVSIHTEDNLLVHKAGTEVITGVKQFENFTFFTEDLTLSNDVAINWDDGSGTSLEMLILGPITPGGTPPVDPDLDSVVLLITAEASDIGATSFTSDIGGHVFTAEVANGGIANIAATPAKFGSRSVLVDDATGFVNAVWRAPTSTDFDFGADDWTIEFHFNAAEPSGTTRPVMGKSLFLNQSFLISISANAANDYRSIFQWSSTGAAFTGGGAQRLWGIGALDTWFHVAFVRFGTSVFHFVDGILVGTESIGTNSIFNSTTDFTIGGGTQDHQAFEANYDNIRITKGVARYTANFIPPTAPFDGSASSSVFNIGDPTTNTAISGAVTQIASPSLVIDGAVSVAGDATLAGILSVVGDSTFSGALGVTGAASVGGALSVGGGSTLSGFINVSGDTTLQSALDVTGLSTFNDDVTISEGSLAIESNNGDAVLFLRADILNNVESANPFIRFEQDGGGVTAIIGITGAPNIDAQGNAFSGMPDNGFAIHHRANTPTIGMGVNGNVAVVIDDADLITLLGGLSLSGTTLSIFDGTGTDSAQFSHSGTDFLAAFSGTTDWNITGTRFVVAPSIAGRAGINIPVGATPAVPVDGDLWVTASDIVARVNGTDESLLAQPPIVATTVQLTAIADAINTDPTKVAGYEVFNTTTNAPVWAIGSADGDVWNDATGALAHTPI